MTHALELVKLFEECVSLSPKVVETKDKGFELRFKNFTIHGYYYSAYSIKTWYITSISMRGVQGFVKPRITFGSTFNFGNTSAVGKYLMNSKESNQKAETEAYHARIDAQDKKALELFKKLLEAEKKS